MKDRFDAEMMSKVNAMNILEHKFDKKSKEVEQLSCEFTEYKNTMVHFLFLFLSTNSRMPNVVKMQKN